MRATFIVLLAALIAVGAFAQPAPQLPPIPRQDVVMVIDNSASMLQSDPLRLRGVAAGLILDAVEISSDVQAGLVMFSDNAETDGHFHEVDWVRHRLQAAQLPAPHGGTNMEEALEKALGMLATSSADIKRIVIVTDGVPASQTGILQNLVPHAMQAGVQIFALGFSAATNQQFLDQVTKPTGGKTLVTPNQEKLLEAAKELVGNLDNIYNLSAHRHLDSGEATQELELPAGADRARVTVILDHPQEFAPDQIQFALNGPPGIGDTTYTVRDDHNDDRVVAWTTFFSTPGKYTFRVTTSRPGVTGHLGLQFFAEALSSMRVQLIVKPKSQQFTFGDSVSVTVQAMTGSGAPDPKTVRVIGSIKTQGGGTQPVTFTDMKATFQVPSVEGKQTLAVRVETPLAHGEAHFDFQASPVPLRELSADPAILKFGGNPLNPAKPPLEDEFLLIAKSAERTALTFSFTAATPVGTVELLGPQGTPLKSGIAEYVLPPQGLKLKVRLKIDPNKALPTATTNFGGTIQFSGPEIKNFTLPFEALLKMPKFELQGKLTDFTLWWDPHRTRAVKLGKLHTDLSVACKFFVTMPATLNGNGGKIADLSLRAGDSDLPDPERPTAGTLRYGPIELPPGDGVPLELVVTPDSLDGWENQPSHPLVVPEIRLISSFGLTENVEPRFWHVAPANLPLLKLQPSHGRRIATLLWNAFALAIFFLFLWLRGRDVLRFRRFRIGQVQTLGYGPVQLGGSGEGAAIALPSVAEPDDVRTVGEVRKSAAGQIVKSEGDPIASNALLAPGETLTIADSPGSDYVLDYIGPTDDGGEVEVTASPARWSIQRLLKWTIILLLLIRFVQFLLGTGFFASSAYTVLRPVEWWFYMK